MQIKLKQAAIVAAIVASLQARGIATQGQKVNITFKQSRKGADIGLVADVTLPDDDEDVPTSNLPHAAEGNFAGKNADLQNAQANAETAKEDVPAAPVVQEHPSEVPANADGSTKTLFS